MSRWVRSARRAAGQRLADALYGVRRLRGGGLFARNVTATFVVQVLSLVFGIANTAVIARLLGVEGKGLVALALLVPNMLGLFLSGGIETSNVYFSGSRRIDVRSLAANSMAFAIVASLLGLLVMAILLLTGWIDRLLPDVPRWLIAVSLFEFPLRMVLRYMSSILLGLQRIIYVNLINLADYVWTFVFTLVLVLGLNLDLAGAVLASAAAVLANVVVSVALVLREGGTLVPAWSRPVMRSTLAFGLRGYVGNVFQFFNYRLDMLLVNGFIGAAGVGIYGTSVRLAELLWNLPNAVGFVIFPKAAATSAAAMNRFTPRVFRVTMVLTTIGAIGLALVGHFLIVLVYGPDFAPAYVPMLVLLPGVLLLGGAKVLTNEIAGRGYPHYNSVTAAISLVLTVGLDLMLIPPYGVLGASIASSISYAVIFAVAVTFYRIVSRRTARAAARQEMEAGEGQAPR